MRKLNIGIIGYKFMGKAHSHAWRSAPRFFEVPVEPVMKVACGRHEDNVKEFADRWGWEETETDWRKVVERDDIDIIDVAVPQNLHHDIAKAAVEAGKHVFLEKPITRTAAEAEDLVKAAKGKNVVTYLNHNYRRCPAIQLAKQLIDEDRIGQVFHWRGAYLQDWMTDPDFPLTWHLREDIAGMGPQIDLNSHSVDLAHYLVGEIEQVTGMTTTFITERVLPDEAASGTFSGKAAADAKKGKVTVDDAAFMTVRFKNGALGSFDTSRFAVGRKNYNYFEIYGSKGSLLFDFERMNELQYYSAEDPDYAQGFRTISATTPSHKYIEGWWPPGHVIGYEHEFTHAAVDFLKAIDSGAEIRPNFEDGLATMRVLEAGVESSRTGKTVQLGR